MQRERDHANKGNRATVATLKVKKHFNKSQLNLREIMHKSTDKGNRATVTTLKGKKALQ